MTPAPHQEPAQDQETVAGVFARLVHDPAEFLIRRWNWKMAIWSGLLRTPLFVGPALQAGVSHAAEAGGLEFAVRFITAGYSAAVVQALRNASPHWLSVSILLVILPAILHVVEWQVHRWAGTPNLGKGMAGSITMSVVAILFNLYAMRRGAFLSGGEGGSFWTDFKRIPVLVAGFLAWPFRRSPD